MNTKVWYLSYFEGVYHTRMFDTFSNANALIVCMVHTMIENHLSSPHIIHGKIIQFGLVSYI